MISWRPIGLWKQTWWSAEAKDKLTILQPRQSSTYYEVNAGPTFKTLISVSDSVSYHLALLYNKSTLAEVSSHIW